ncbi:MAG: alanine racemase [Romboutsia sp.]
MNISRQTWVEINMDNLEYNINEIRKFISTTTKLGVVLKANAYGHGAIEVSRLCDYLDVDYICVATLLEAIEIRKNNIYTPILVMGGINESYVLEAIKNNITITIFDINQALKINEILSRSNKKVKVHIKIDTGFNRIGFKVRKGSNGFEDVNKDTIKNLLKVLKSKNIDVEGIFTHLALASEESDYSQYKKFMKILKEIDKDNKIPIKHICDSIAMCKYIDFHMDMVRVGACIYGYNSRNEKLVLKEVMTLKSKIIQIKEIEKGEGISYDATFVAQSNMKIGILPCGYADGIPRNLSNKGYVLVNEKRCNIIGMVCMDQCIIDITNLSEEEYSDVVIFFGENGPNLSIVSKIAQTNKNEILSKISNRLSKVYLKNGSIIKVIDNINICNF